MVSDLTLVLSPQLIYLRLSRVLIVLRSHTHCVRIEEDIHVPQLACEIVTRVMDLVPLACEVNFVSPACRCVRRTNRCTKRCNISSIALKNNTSQKRFTISLLMCMDKHYFISIMFINLKRIVGKPYFSDQFKVIIKRYKSWDTIQY